MSFFGFFVIIAALLAIGYVFSAVIIVPQGFEYTHERLGRYLKTLRPGLHIILPIIESIGARINMKEMVIDVPTQDIITKDNAMVKVDGVIFFQVIDAAQAAYKVHDLQLSIVNLTMTNIRTVMGGMDLDELLSQRERINAQLMDVVDEATVAWGVKVTRIEIKDIAPPRDLVESMGRQMKAERDKRAQVLEAEGQRQAQVLIASGEKEAAILKAEGEKQSAFLQAEARERQAAAEAKATDMMSESLSRGNVQAANYFVARAYIDSLAQFADSPSQKLVFMPLEASQVMGAIGGIAELTKHLIADQPQATMKIDKTSAKAKAKP